MKYLFLLYDNEDEWEGRPESERMEIVGAYMAYSEALRRSNAFIAAEPLDHSRNAKRARSGRIEDGPFADGKEQVGGFYLIDAKDLDDAMNWAAKCPCASYGKVEIRPVWNIGQ